MQLINKIPGRLFQDVFQQPVRPNDSTSTLACQHFRQNRTRLGLEEEIAETGYIIVADITGYTAYLRGAELEHAQEKLESLLNTILKEIHPPLTISRTEGHAVISYSSANAFIMGQTLLEMLEQDLFCRFNRFVRIPRAGQSRHKKSRDLIPHQLIDPGICIDQVRVVT